MVNIHGQYAEPSIYEVCQISLYWHYLLKSYTKTAHQRTRSGEGTHFCLSVSGGGEVGLDVVYICLSVCSQVTDLATIHTKNEPSLNY